MKHTQPGQHRSAQPQAAPASASAERPRPRRQRRLAVHAAEGFCKDKVSLNTGGTVAAEGTSTLVFLGAGGQQVEVDARKDTYMLDSGLEAGLELPFTCRGGICGACVGKVTEGEVDMSDIPDLTFTMSEEEAADGMTLLCMARPVSDRVVVETQSDWGYSLGVGEWKGPTGEIGGKFVDPLMGKKWDKAT